MSSDWLPSTVGEFCPFQYGKNLPKRNRRKGLIPVISSAGVVDTHELPLINSAGVIIGRKGTVGSVTFSSEPFWPIDTAFFIEDEPNSRDIRFVYYLLKALGLESMNTDSAVPGLNRDNAHALSILTPPLTEQKRIADYLQSFDDRIAHLRETNKTLEAIAQAIFKSWFIDFDPVRAKMEGRQPEGLDEQTAALFPDEFEEADLGLIPKGWRPVTLGSFIDLAYGKALRADTRVVGNVPVYGSGGITGWHNHALVTEPSIIVGRKGTVGSLYWESRPFFPIDTVFYVKTKKPLVYVHELLKQLPLRDMNTDAAVPGLNRENVYRLLIPLPPNPIVNSFTNIAAALRKNIDNNNDQENSLVNLRDTLLPRLISGRLRLPEAEVLVAEHA